jgi:predicted O-methyltransferase YrrM
MKLSIDLETYITKHMDAESEVLKKLNRYTNMNVLRARMLSGHLQGQMLKMFCRMINPMHILEIGTFTGYSAISMAEGLSHPEAHIHTIELNDELSPIINQFIREAGLQDTITLHIGDALDVIPTLNTFYDLVFMDGDKRQYPAYYKLLLPLVKKGGYILADNVLWDGKVLEDPDQNDDYTRGIIQFNQLVSEDKHVEKVILPIRDGLTIIRKK